MALKAGYVSSFFHRDNWMKPVWGLINQHDRSVVEVHLFSDCAASEMRHGYCAHSQDRFCDTSQLSNEQLAKLVGEMDVLIDLNGYSNMRRLPLFAKRVAPVVLGWFNMYATTGMKSFDYLIADDQVVRPEEEQFYSEKIIRVQGSYLTFEVSYAVPPVEAREHKGFVFGVLASQYKITDEVIESWSRILKGSPESRLLVKNRQMASLRSREFMVHRFARHGVSAERLDFEGPEDHFEFLKTYDRIDIALDTFPYNGGTTTTEAIWQGVPVLTFYGDRWASRTSASILRAGGLGEFVADDLEGYIKLGIELGNGRRLDGLRMGMRNRLLASSVCDTRGFARQMEAIYQRCNKLAADGL